MDYFFLGDEELVIAFRFIGIEGMAVRNAEEAVKAFTQITENTITQPDIDNVSGGCQVLILTEETASWLGDNMIEWQLSGRYPLLVEIPGIAGRLPGKKTLVEAIREAIGINV
ncbi:MAG: ATPase V [Treponema sp.]|nr:ATPase V [Treponema sp.]